MRFMRRAFGPRMAYYRLIFVLFSIVTLLPVLFLQHRIDSPLLWSTPLYLRVLRWIGVAISLMIFWFAARQYDQSFFFGLRQIREHRAGRDAEFSGFTSKGILRRMRHPYYSAGILLLLCWGEPTAANLILKVIGTGYFLAGAVLEERKLVAEFGEEYRRYQREVPMFIPCFRGGAGE
jgi:protein-S-isoprenylcysteine O-methyltransferase Ste14